MLFELKSEFSMPNIGEVRKKILEAIPDLWTLDNGTLLSMGDCGSVGNDITWDMVCDQHFIKSKRTQSIQANQTRIPEDFPEPPAKTRPSAIRIINTRHTRNANLTDMAYRHMIGVISQFVVEDCRCHIAFRLYKEETYENNQLRLVSAAYCDFKFDKEPQITVSLGLYDLHGGHGGKEEDIAPIIKILREEGFSKK